MITRFRIEGEAIERQDLIDEMALNATRIISEISRYNGQRLGEWECTQDVVTGMPGGYKGRMVFRYHEEAQGE